MPKTLQAHTLKPKLILVAILAAYAMPQLAFAENRAEATLMRVFGASRRQVGVAYVAEFACIGLIAAFVAAIAANLLAYYLSATILNIPFQLNITLAISTMLIAALVIPLAAWLGLRRFLNVPARQLLNSI